MREILFRGKNCLDEGEWVYGNLEDRDGEYHITSWFIRPNSDNYLDCDVCMVDNETVGQYTGLTDKNGKKIFEGDIVDCWSEGKNARGTVQQRKDGLWIIYPSWQKNIMWGLCPDINGGTTVEVIGNIHDNPELLEELQE